MADSSNCIFCKIVAGELPSAKAFSDDVAMAFADISPVTPVHVLVIPKQHVERVEDLGADQENLVGHLIRVAGQVAAESGLSENGYRLVVNQGHHAGQLVDHLHVHVLGGREMGQIA